MEGASAVQPPVQPASSLEERIGQWSAGIQAAQKQVNLRSTPGWIAILVGIVFLLVFWLGPASFAKLALVFFALGVIAGAVLLYLGRKLQKEQVQKLAGEIRQSCEDGGLTKEQVVKSLFEKVQGGVCRALVKTLDPDLSALLELGKRGVQFVKSAPGKIQPMQIKVNFSSGNVSSVTVEGEQNVDNLSTIAVDCLAHKGYAEGIAALAMVQMLYTEIAPPAGELLMGFQSNPGLQKVAVSAVKLMGSFDLKPEMKAVRETLARRRTQSFLELLMKAQQQQVGLDDKALSDTLDVTALRVRHEALVSACIEYIGKRTKEVFLRNKAYELLALIPDVRTQPYLMEGFSQLFFFPQGIEAAASIGEEMYPQLVEAVRTGSGPLRFNTALALGFSKVEVARPILAELLPTVTAPIERAGICYALVRLGQPEHMASIVELLNHQDQDTCHAAAIALEHLEEPLDGAVYLQHLQHRHMLVRLRLTRKLGAQGTQDPALVDALIKRFTDDDEDVRSAAVTTVGKLSPELVYDHMVELAHSSNARARRCAYEVLGSLAQPQAASLLTSALAASSDQDARRAIISALGEVGVVEAAGQIARYLDNDDLSGAAFWALLRISLKDKEAGVAPLRNQGKYKMKLLFLQSLHGDKQAKDQFKALLRSSDFATLIQALEYAQILRDPDFEAPLRALLTYRNHNHFPGDRYVSYLAVKTLSHIQLAKV